MSIEKKGLNKHERAAAYLVTNLLADTAVRVGVGFAFTAAATAMLGSAAAVLPAAIIITAFLAATWGIRMHQLLGERKDYRYDESRASLTMTTFNDFIDGKKKNWLAWGLLHGVFSNPPAKIMGLALPVIKILPAVLALA